MNKRKILLIIGTILALGAVAFAAHNILTPVHTGEPVEVVDEPNSIVEQWPEYDLNQFDQVVDIDYGDFSHVPKLASELKESPDWNPTQSVPGMYRVNDNVATLSTDKVTPYKILMNTGYIMLRGNGVFSSKHSKELGIIGLNDDNVLEFNELIIFDYENNVLHKLRLEDGYSLAANTHDPFDGTSIYIGLEGYKDLMLPIWMYKYDDLNDGPGARRYILNLETGEISK